jgi:hypothetical protein
MNPSDSTSYSLDPQFLIEEMFRPKQFCIRWPVYHLLYTILWICHRYVYVVVIIALNSYVCDSNFYAKIWLRVLHAIQRTITLSHVYLFGYVVAFSVFFTPRRYFPQKCQLSRVLCVLFVFSPSAPIIICSVFHCSLDIIKYYVIKRGAILSGGIRFWGSRKWHCSPSGCQSGLAALLPSAVLIRMRVVSGGMRCQSSICANLLNTDRNRREYYVEGKLNLSADMLQISSVPYQGLCGHCATLGHEFS